MGFQIIQVIYWLALATWFGGVLFIAVAAPIIFSTVRESKPILPSVLSVNLEDQHGTLLAGTIVGNLLTRLVKVEMVCAAALLVGLIGQWFFIERAGFPLTAAYMRSVMYVAAVVLVLYDYYSLWPKIWKHRQEYIDHADEPDVANPAKDAFDRTHQESVMILSGVLFLLLGMILFSGGIVPAATYVVTK